MKPHQLPLILTFLLISSALFCQDQAELANELTVKGTKFGNANSYDSSIYYYTKAIALYKDLSENKGDKWYEHQLDVQKDMALIYRNKGNPARALSIMDTVASEIAKYYPGTRLHSDALKTKGIAFISLGKYDSTIFYYKESLKVSQAIPDFPQRPLAFTLNNLGHLYSILGEYDLSIQYHNEAISIRRRLYKGKLHLDLAQSYLNIGNVHYFTGEVDTALDYWKSVVDVSEQLGNKDTRYSAMALGNLGEVYKELGDLEQSLMFNEKALDLKLEVYGENHQSTAHSYATLAATKLELGQTDEAISLFDKSIRIKRNTVGRKHPEIAEIYNNYGKLFEKNDQTERALEFYQKALIANVPDFEDSLNLYAVPAGSNYLNPNFLIDSYLYKVSLLEGSPKGEQYILNHVNSADQFIQNIRTNTTTLNDQTQLGERFSRLYEYGLKASLASYESDNGIDNAERAFQFFEKNKSVALNFSIKESQAREYLNMPEELLAEIDSIQSSIEKNQSMALSNRTNDSIETALFESRRYYDDLMEDLEKEYPVFYSFKYDLSTPTINDIQEYLDESTSLVEYFMGESNMYGVIITKENISFFMSDSISNLKDDIIDFRKSIAEQSPSYDTISNRLYDQIFKDVDQKLTQLGITNVVIIYDDILTLLPFELLNEKDGFLVSNYTLRYANSSSILINSSRKSRSNSELISFAPEFSQTTYLASADVVRSELAKLPGALDEAVEVSKFFKGESITKSDATEESFKNSASNFGVIHLATHAIIDDENPDNSKLVFSLTDTLNEDGYLHAYEIYNLDLNAQLVTLSACNTGFGKIQKGEGVMSLSRAFAYAGVPATVVSLWPASDKSTPELMKHFYQNLKDGQPKDIALNNARKMYLETAEGKARHPFYWGGFVMIGDNSPIENRRNLLVWLLPIVFIIVLISTILKRKRNA